MKDSPQSFTIKASSIARLHTYLALTAFLSALVIGCLLHYKKIVKNGVAGYPEEWFPSVSAAIGDWYPERAIFQLCIALTSGPRFALVFLQYILTRSEGGSLPWTLLITGIIRTFSCGGWVYVTSSDHHDAHDVLMITYIVCNIPWMFGGIYTTPKGNEVSRRRRIMIASSFWASIIPLVYFFIRHKVHLIPGAYTYYAFFEWSLILLDIFYDSVCEVDFVAADLEVKITSPFLLAKSNYPSATVLQIHEEKLHRSGGDRLTAMEKSELSESYQFRTVISFLSDVYLSYVLWSIWTSLMPSLFYFSVWDLAISGAEAALLSLLSPILLEIPALKSWARTKNGRLVLHGLTVTGLLAYRWKDAMDRLYLVAFANIILFIGAAIDWSGLSNGTTEYHALLFGLGNIISSLSKHANHSNNPIWPIVDDRSGGYNKTGLLLFIVALWEQYTRDSGQHTSNKSNKSRSNKLSLNTRTSFSSWFFPAVSLGSLLYTLHVHLGDSAVLITWSWTGYPIKGPLPNLHGYLTLMAQCLGALLPLIASSLPFAEMSFLANPLWFLFGAISSTVMYRFKDWPGYIGGLCFAVWSMSIIPIVFQQASKNRHIGRTYFVAWFTAILLYLANVWTVAYAFVPGGVYLRERSDLVLIAQIVLLAPAFAWPQKSSAQYGNIDIGRVPRSFFYYILAAIALVSMFTTVNHLPVNIPQPHRPASRIVRAGIWTVHFGIDLEGRDSQRRMKNLIKDMELDVVGLLETDLHRAVYGNRDLTRVIAEDLGYYVDLGPGPNQHTWGAVLLSKFPIINTTHHLLPSPHGELAPCIVAVLDAWGTELTVLVAHNGQEEDPLDRELQSTEMARIMSELYPRPLIFLGYLVTKPLASRPNPYEIMVTDGRVHDIEETDWDRWCEYIFYRGLYRTGYARVSRSDITDTELQIGQFVVPVEGGILDDSAKARYLRTSEENLPDAHRFPKEYYGNEQNEGKNGHFYHVYNRPLYYQMPPA